MSNHQITNLTSSIKIRQSNQVSKLTETSKQLLNNAPSAILMSPQTYAINSRLSNMLTNINKLLQGGETEESARRLLQLKEKLNFMKKNGKEFDLKIQLICSYNLACSYQVMAFEKIKQTALNDCVLQLKNSLQLMKSLLQQNKQQSTSNNYKLKLKLFHAKMVMQYCALLSQIQNHQLALKNAKQVLSMLISVFQYGFHFCQEKLKEISLLKQKGNKDSSVAFIEGLIIGSKEYLNQLLMLQRYDVILENNGKFYQKIKQNSYFWKDNFENNCKVFKKQMQKYHNKNAKNIPYFQEYSPQKHSQHLQQNSSKSRQSTPNLMRNSLGLKLNNSWIKEINIGKIMHMNPIDYMNLIEPDNIIHDFSYKNLIQKIVWVAVVYFSIATQMRFIENHQKQKKKGQIPTSSIKKSQLFHFKAIQLVCKYIKQDCPLVDHLINSYFRHYHNSLVTIQEQSSIIQQSSINLQIPKFTVKQKLSHKKLLGPHQQENYLMKKGNGCKKIQLKYQMKIISYTNNEDNLTDSGELQKDCFLTRSQKIYKSGQKQLSNSLKLSKLQKSLSGSNLQVLKIVDMGSTTSTKAKDSLTIKQHKDPPHKKGDFKKSKSKRNKSTSKKSISKIISH